MFVSGQESHFLTAGVGRAAGWWHRSPSGLPVGAMRAQEPRAGRRHWPVPQVLRAGAGLPVGAGTWEGPTCSTGEGSWWQSGSRTLSGPPEACEHSLPPASCPYPPTQFRIPLLGGWQKNYCTSGLGTWEGVGRGGSRPGNKAPVSLCGGLGMGKSPLSCVLPAGPARSSAGCESAGAHLGLGLRVWGCAPWVRGLGLSWPRLPARDHRFHSAAFQLLLMKGDLGGLCTH